MSDKGWIKPTLDQKLAMTISMLILLLLTGNGWAQLTTHSAGDLIDSIGVNTHFSNTYGVYTHPDLPDMVNEIGFTHVRDNTKSQAGADVMAYLYDTYGIRTNMCVDNLTSVAISTRVGWLAQDWAISLEGPNEPDVFLRSYQGLWDVSRPSKSPVSVDTYLATREYQFDLYAAATSTGKPILSPAMGYAKFGPTLGVIPYDGLSFHRYPYGTHPGTVPFASRDTTILRSYPGSDGKERYATETGYHTAVTFTQPNQAPYIPEATQGKYIPRLVAHGFLSGIKRTYIYELANAGTNTADKEQHFGLVYYESNPANPLQLKPSGQTMKRLFGHLKNTGADYNTFTPTDLDMTIDAGTNGMSNLRHLLVQKDDTAGTYLLLLWQELSSYDATTQTLINNPTLPVALRVNRALSSIKAYNLNSDTPIYQNTSNPKGVTLQVPDEILVVELTPGTYTPSATKANVEVFATVPTTQEGSGSYGQFTFTRTGGNLSLPLSTWIETVGQAVKGTDYNMNFNGRPSELIIPANESSITINVVALADSLIEGDEQVIVRYWGGSADYESGEHWAAAVTIKDTQSQADLVVTDLIPSNADPLPGDGVTFVARVKNQGTAALASTAELFFKPDENGGYQRTVAIASGLAPGASVDINVPLTWPAIARQTVLEAKVRNAAESDVDNNDRMELFTIPFASRRDDFQVTTLDTSHWTGWNVTGNWQLATYGSNTVLQNSDGTSGYASPVRAYLPTTFATSWTAEFAYDWKWGGNTADTYGHNYLTLAMELLDEQNNGYRITIYQGDGGNSAYTNKVTRIYPITNGVVGSTALVEGAGYNQAGFKSVGLTQPRLKKIKVVYDQVGRTLGVYGDTDGDAVLELFAQATTGLTVDRIACVQFNPYTSSTCAPLIDNVRVNLLNPLTSLTDDFQANSDDDPPADWTVSGTWQAKAYDGNVVIENRDAAAGNRYITRTLDAACDGALTVSYDYDWTWGGNIVSGVSYGHYTLRSTLEILDANGNGYFLKVHQGNNNNPGTYDNLIIELYRAQAGLAEVLLATGTGYNEPGWKTRQIKGEAIYGPDLKRVRMTFEPATRMLKVCADPDRDGKMQLVIAFQDTGVSLPPPDRVCIGAEGFGSSEKLVIDHVQVDQVYTRVP